HGSVAPCCRSTPVPVRGIAGKWPALADRARTGLPGGPRALERLEQPLLGQLLEERRLPAPEDVRLRLALPLHDAPVGDRRARGYGVHLHGDVPLLPGIVGEGLEGRVVDELRDWGDEVELAFYLSTGGLSRCGRLGPSRRHA